MNAFVPGMVCSPFGGIAPGSRSCALRVAHAGFLGAPVARRATMPAAAAEYPRAPKTKVGSVRMDVTVVVGENEPIESAIRRFKKDVTKSGHLFELRRRRYFETATEKRLRKATAAKRKARIARSQSERNRKR